MGKARRHTGDPPQKFMENNKEFRNKHRIAVDNLLETLSADENPKRRDAAVDDEVPDKKEKSQKTKRDIPREKLHHMSRRVKEASKFSARSDLLLPEETGYLEADQGEKTHRISQKQIQNVVDITSAAKRFSLELTEMGPYVGAYSREGRHLLLGGRMGHLAAFDWLTKKLLCEINVKESVHAVQWLHQPTMFAAAQKQWTYIYDVQGIELHCLKALYKVSAMTFLPYHFLLVAATESGYIHWVDVSTGTIINQLNTKFGRIPFIRQNPTNGIVVTGHSNGVVRMWSPNSSQNVAEMLAHRSAVTDVVVDRSGMHLITAGLDRLIKLWDIRMLRPMQSYNLGRAPTQLSLSDTNVLAVNLGQHVELYKDMISGNVEEPYLRHKVSGTVSTMQFCPFEDVLGIAHSKGFESILVPGSGEANYDSYEVNPLLTTKQRQEAEVKMLLNKIQPNMICLNPDEMLSRIDSETYHNKRRQRSQPPKTSNLKPK